MVVVPAEDPAAFLPLVRRCAGAAPMAVRRLAAQALSPLVTAEGLPALVQELAESLPEAGDPVRHNEVCPSCHSARGSRNAATFLPVQSNTLCTNKLVWSIQLAIQT